ncbi:uncharacterized protein LOC119261819 isoform X2 [Pygocentrus nattereri]|uniref:uncharacterized protein LOC119261819 isoform X2 n=1 Tax=Pygocentrus nattereri TaxID=42514 RepID=UPI0018919DFB|nr:uncharacterized protein LOC119261819 isoform X2 [Pygocentrus nattereri]
MIHDQYLKGDFSLTISDADYSMMGTYTCECGNSELCDVRLQVEETPEAGNNISGSSHTKGTSHVYVSAVPLVRVKLHDSATLPCSETCSGLVRWTEFHNPTDVLAECDQTSCRSVKEGYQMIHDQYLKGDFSLTISDADYSMMGTYTCECGNSEVCDVRLQVEETPEAGNNISGSSHTKGTSHGSESAVGPVKVKLHDSATLPCSGRCPGLVRWTEFSKPSDVLAECDQTSCRSVKEGYQMIHDQYLKGDFSLTITDADFSKKGVYASDCDGKDLCDVELQVEDTPEPEKRPEIKGDIDKPSHGEEQRWVPVLVAVLTVVLMLVLLQILVHVSVAAGWYMFKARSMKSSDQEENQE